MTKRELENTIKEMENILEMLRKELAEVIKEEEAQTAPVPVPAPKAPKAPKKNINKCITVDDVLAMPTLDAESPIKYKDIAWDISEEEMRKELETIELKHIKKIAKEAGYTERSTSKKKAIDTLVRIIMSRRTRGDVFKR
jgi:hypothetical protein